MDAASQQKWHQDLEQAIGRTLGQAAVYLSPPTWGTAELIPKIPNALPSIVSFSGHAYPQSACGGASTNLQALQNHPYDRLDYNFDCNSNKFKWYHILHFAI